MIITLKTTKLQSVNKCNANKQLRYEKKSIVTLRLILETIEIL